MKPFDYTRTARASEAVHLVAAHPQGMFVAGGTELLNLVKDQVLAPDLVVDVNQVPLSGIELRDGTLHVGAMARMRDVADHEVVRSGFPVLSQALLASASPQIRNRASIGGNLMQRTRCWYYRDAGSPCNKRGTGTYTVMSQLAAHVLGLALDDVDFVLGDTSHKHRDPGRSA